jgi:hypothetical protein
LFTEAVRESTLEIDLVGADEAPVAQRIAFAGSIKWREQQPFDERDLAKLITHRSQLPGADQSMPLVAVTRTAATVSSVPALGPADLLSAWTIQHSDRNNRKLPVPEQTGRAGSR